MRRLTVLDFERLMKPFAPFERQPTLAAAVSGGRDSLALVLLAHGWALARGGTVLALIVDHGLRAGSATEAKATRATLKRLGISAAVLKWTGAKPRSAIQQAAREARYRLLFEACRARGILHLLVAHHADDQAETIAMRRGRGSGPDGLAGMAALLEHSHLRLLRPLLAVPRARLTATLEAAGIEWIEDPSNADPRFERVRLRQAGVAPAADRGARRATIERQLAAACVDVLEEADGALALDRGRLARLGAGLRERLVSRVVQAVGGGDHPPRRERLRRAVARLVARPARGKSGRAADFTFAACTLMLRQAPGGRRLRWLVRPEKGRTGPQPLVPAAFFGCGATAAHHVDWTPSRKPSSREPIQP